LLPKATIANCAYLADLVEAKSR